MNIHSAAGIGRLFALSLALMLAYSAGSAETAEIQQRISAVHCPASDQTAPVNTQTGESLLATVERTAAEQLAYYKAENSPGVYAPKGWSCLAWNGLNGSILLVTPKRMTPPYFPLPVVTGPAVMIQSSDAGSSGRFHVAIVAAQLFPLTGNELITRVRQEHLISDSSFDAASYPDDQLRYLSDRFVEYTTPPNRTGLGTDSMFEASNLPIRGLTILHLEADQESTIELRVRLPPGLSTVSDAIMQLEAACVQLPRGCRGLQ
jgi:hypothetical protein